MFLIKIIDFFIKTLYQREKTKGVHMKNEDKLADFFNKVVRGPTLRAMKEIARTVDPNSVDSIHDHHRNLWVARAMLWVASRDIFQPNEFFSRDDYEKFALAYQSWNFLRSFDTINRETFENSTPGIFGGWKVKELLHYCDLSSEVLGRGEIAESFENLRHALVDYQKSPDRENWERVNEILKTDIYYKTIGIQKSLTKQTHELCRQRESEFRPVRQPS